MRIRITARLEQEKRHSKTRNPYLDKLIIGTEGPLLNDRYLCAEGTAVVTAGLFRNVRM